MGSTRLRRPPAPTDAERARSLALRGGEASLGDGCAALTPVDIAAARPDPFCLMEDHWLAHLEAAHPEVFVGLAQHLPPELSRSPAPPGPRGPGG